MTMKDFPPVALPTGRLLGLQEMLTVLLTDDDDRFPPCRFADGAALREQFRSHAVIPTVWWRASRGDADDVVDR